MASRLTGRIVEWKNKFGWIEPDEPINHPEAMMHKGRVYLSQGDVEMDVSGIGAHVSFFVYADGTGLGAMNCRPAQAPDLMKPINKTNLPQSQPKAPPKASAPGTLGGLPQGARTTAVNKAQRKRINEELYTGTVKTWKGGFGWVTSHEVVDHPLFRGDVYLHSSDVTLPEPLEVGMEVCFFVYADTQGLGAEVVDPNAAWPEPKATPAAAAPLGGSSKLNAKPKAGSAGSLPKATPTGALAIRPGMGAGQPSPLGGDIVMGGSSDLAATPKAPPGGPPGAGPSSIGAAKLNAKPKASSSAIPSDMDPELAMRLKVWLSDRGG